MAGKLIVIEGLDGSGKATQTKLLYEKLKAKGENVIKVSFPDYESNSSALIKMYLSGEFGSHPDDVNAYAASSFYAVDRYASFKINWQKEYENGATILCDRYTTSNAIHQCCKLEREKWDEFLAWLFHFEYALLGIPAPDSVIYLQVDVDESQELMRERYKGHEEKKDIHEADVEYLRKARKAADYCADKLGWRVVKCTENGRMRSVDDIHKEIIGQHNIGEGRAH